jgi:hypothetical protein
MRKRADKLTRYLSLSLSLSLLIVSSMNRSAFLLHAPHKQTRRAFFGVSARRRGGVVPQGRLGVEGDGLRGRARQAGEGGRGPFGRQDRGDDDQDRDDRRRKVKQENGTRKDKLNDRAMDRNESNMGQQADSKTSIGMLYKILTTTAAQTL